jgi:hypothetical protein
VAASNSPFQCRYPAEMRERALRMMHEVIAEPPSDSGRFKQIWTSVHQARHSRTAQGGSDLERPRQTTVFVVPKVEVAGSSAAPRSTRIEFKFRTWVLARPGPRVGAAVWACGQAREGADPRPGVRGDWGIARQA